MSGYSRKRSPADDNNHVEPPTNSTPLNSSTGLNLNTRGVAKRGARTGIDFSEIPDSVEILDGLLQQNLIDVNGKDKDGKTLLLKSVNMFRSDSFIRRLLKSNCDPNVSDKHKETPLYAAVTRPTSTIAYELIKSGADINATTKHGHSVLHQAVDYRNLDAVCLLLYYGADVNVLCKKLKMTPFMNVLSYGRATDAYVASVANILINYYVHDVWLDNFLEGYTDLFCAMKYGRSHIVVRLVQMGANVNYVILHGGNMLVDSLTYNNATLFKLVWDKFDYKIILNSERPFLLSYIENCCFETCEWVDCLRLILNSCVRFELVQHYNDWVKNKGIRWSSFFQELLKSFHRKDVQLSDRLAIIYIVLNLRAEVNIPDITTAYRLYGFNDELEIFIYFLNYDNIANEHWDCEFLLLPLILALEDDLRAVQIIFQWDGRTRTEHRWLGFFSRLCYDNVLKISPTYWAVQDPVFNEKLLCVPKFPSLLELSRNQARKFIKQTYKITRPYHFHDIVKSLNLPPYIKDVIRFKAPVYK